jgi:serine/threonine-protein kinase
MLSACFVHPGANARQIMIRAATDPARPLETIMPDLPASVVAVVSRALAFERSQRWPSAAAMRDAVLQAYSELFGSAPVRSDVAALVERTSAALGAQPTQLYPLTDPQKVVAGRRSSRALPSVTPNALARALETTMSTPVAVLGQAAPRKTRWFLALSSGVAVLGLGAWLALARPAPPRSSEPPVAVVSTTEVARADTTPSPAPTTTPATTTKVASDAARAVISDSSPRSAKPASSSGRARKAPRSASSSAAARGVAAPPAPLPRAEEDPLTLRLQ